ncbi:unnamed protein product, partial [Anisakis simplex]|uniref:PPM-type phosphatase domain-containing protein n=1 Tax=Anisakis simplex TaxID=6269 RepID=A0A0M3JXM2_ANISI
MQGQKLEHCTIVERYKFTPPKFMNRGFSDIPKFPGGTWRWKHQNFSFFACCGLRPYMEDRMHYMNDPHHNLSIFSIFDGHGGPFVSQYLEEHFSNAIRNRLLKFGPDARRQSLAVDAYDTVTQAVVTEVHNIDDAISRLDPSLTSFTGSTLISAILEQNRYLTVVNVGDSRAVACDPKGRAIALSADHKPSQAEERRRIENAGGFILEDGVERVQGILSVTRLFSFRGYRSLIVMQAFGDTQLKRACVLTAHPDV